MTYHNNVVNRINDFTLNQTSKQFGIMKTNNDYQLAFIRKNDTISSPQSV